MSKASEFTNKFFEEEEKSDSQKTSGAIRALIDAKPSDDNDDQGKFAQLVKGMSFSDDPDATAFMKKLMGMVDDKSFGEFAK